MIRSLRETLKYLVEDNPRYRVVAIAEDAEGAIAAAEAHDPDLVLLDLHLANASTGFSVAVRLSRTRRRRACSSAARRPVFRCPTSRSAA